MEKVKTFLDKAVSLGLDHPSLFNMKDEDTSNVSARQFAAFFGKFPSVLTSRFRLGKVDYENAWQFVKNCLQSNGFDIYMQFEDSVFRNKLGINHQKSRFKDDNMEAVSYVYSFINKNKQIIITYWQNDATLDCIYSIEDKEAQRFVEDFTMQYRKGFVKKEPQINTIKYLYKGNFGFDTRSMEIKEPEQFDITQLYNDDFVVVDKNIKSFIGEERSGLVILHGIQGSGKTTYIRHLINNSEKTFVYLPMEMASYLSDPELMTYITQHLKNSVFVIEDCEQLLQDRGSNPYQINAGLSNILNISDGLLGDSLCLKFICTFNNDIKKIDQALLRKGRLVEKYQFGKLSKEKTARMISKIYGTEGEYGEMALAEIFNLKNENHGKSQEKRKIGFAI